MSEGQSDLASATDRGDGFGSEAQLDHPDLAANDDERAGRQIFDAFQPFDGDSAGGNDVHGPSAAFGEDDARYGYGARRSAEAADLAGLYVQNALQCLKGNDRHGGGLHVLLSSLAKLNTRRSLPAQWIHTLVSTMTRQLPEVQDVAEYIEAYTFVQQFPHYNAGGTGVAPHIPGFMPMRMYSKTAMPGG